MLNLNPITGTAYLKSYRKGDKVYWKLALLGKEFFVSIPENLVPDQFENRKVEVEMELGVGSKGVYLRVTKMELSENQEM